jgi:hypothetical protein
LYFDDGTGVKEIFYTSKNNAEEWRPGICGTQGDKIIIEGFSEDEISSTAVEGRPEEAVREFLELIKAGRYSDAEKLMSYTYGGLEKIWKATFPSSLSRIEIRGQEWRYASVECTINFQSRDSIETMIHLKNENGKWKWERQW